jgi:hypothetical protein
MLIGRLCWHSHASSCGIPDAFGACLQIEGTIVGQEKLAKDILFAKSRGVATSGDALWLNGQLLRQEGNWRQVLMYYMQMEMQKVQVWACCEHSGFRHAGALDNTHNASGHVS